VSVVHTDSVENMNCLVSGTKRFVFVPPEYAVSSTGCDVTFTSHVYATV